MRNLKNSYLFKRIKAKYYSFLLHELTPPPVLYFLIFAYSHLSLEPIPPSFGVFLFGIAVKILMVSNFNFLFILAPFFNVNPIIAILMLIISLFACNEKWKVYLFIFAIGDNAFFGSDSGKYFLAIFSTLICLQTYRILLFQTIRENIHFFVGMAAISTYYWLDIVGGFFNINKNSGVIIVLVLSTASLSRSLIDYRINKMKKINLANIVLDREIGHLVKELETDFENPINFLVRLKAHSKYCLNLECFCRNKELKGKPEYFIRNIYEITLGKLQFSSDSLLFEHHIDFLLKNKQIINALHLLSSWKTYGYFSFTAKNRSLAKIQSYLSKQSTSNLYQHQYTYALQYDEHSLFVAVQINKILNLKLQFWNQINKECPRVVRLQNLGYEILDRMYKLNKFYNYSIKVFQQKIFVFDSTVLYAMYMLSTTNFKQYAEIIIKNTAKLLEEVYIFQNNASQTFALRVIVKNQLKCFYDHPDHTLRELRQQKVDENQDKKNYKLMIDAVSSGLCKILHLTKAQLVNHQLKTIIPDGYKQVHSARLNYLLDFDTAESSKRMDPLKIIHKEIKLPIKGNNGYLVMGYICIKFLVDPELGLTFLSIVKLIHDKSSNILIDFSGKITEMEEGFNQDILMHSQVKKYLNKLRSSWVKEKIIVEEKFNIMMNSANYIITLNSPYLALFQESQKFQHPPIHIEIVNEETSRNRNAEADKNNKIGRQIRHMQTALNHYDTSSSTNSSKGGTSAVNILTVFSENNTVQLYRLLYVTFVAIITCCMISNIGVYIVTELPWDTTAATNNPINDTMNFNAIKMLTMKGLVTLNDEKTYFQEKGLNITRIAQYFGFKDYASSAVAFTATIQSAYKDSLYNLIGKSSHFLSDDIKNLLGSYIDIPNPNMDNLTESFQTIRLEELIMLFATDFNLMTHLKLNQTIIEKSYSPTIAKVQNVSYFSDIIDDGVQQTQQISLIVHGTLIAFSVILLLPIAYLLRKRLSLHQKIFDLLVSIDAGEVQREIKSLQYISNILRNFKESNEIMKMNVLGYEQNVIYPKIKGSRSSVDNQMVQGLEKYDVNHETYEPVFVTHEAESLVSRKSSESFKITNSIKLRQSENLKSSVGSLIKSKFISTKQQSSMVKRKRAGELDLEGSILDPNQTFVPLHCIVYAIGISFLLFLALSIVLNLDYNSKYISLKNILLKVYDEQMLFQQYLITVKLYLTGGGPAIKKTFNVSDEISIIVSDVNHIPTYNYFDGDTFYSDIFANCTDTTVVPNIFREKYCQFNYSEVILKGEFGTLFKELSQLRYAYDHDLPLYQTPEITLQNIKQKFYYLQSLNIRLEELVLNKVNLIFLQIIDLSAKYGENKLILLTVSIIWGITCFLIGLAIEIRMKQGYFKEVFMITLLNNEMILTNKRVESFLESIAKNSYA